MIATSATCKHLHSLHLLAFCLSGWQVIFICRHLLPDKLHPIELSDLIRRRAEELRQVVHEPNLKRKALLTEIIILLEISLQQCENCKNLSDGKLSICQYYHISKKYFFTNTYLNIVQQISVNLTEAMATVPFSAFARARL